MASSRWKRFAFFDRHTLNLPSHVLDDLIVVNTRSGSRRHLSESGDSLSPAQTDSISLVVTTAALPVSTATKQHDKTTPAAAVAASTAATETPPEDVALAGMWSTLTACTSPSLTSVEGDDHNDNDGKIRLPSQSEQLMEPPQQSPLVTKTAVDGLVLLFCSSYQTDLIHCLDLTVRCNPSQNTNSATRDDDTDQALEDLDGWRGYFAPFGFREPASGTRSRSSGSVEDRHADHLGDSTPSLDNAISIRGLATCRDLQTSQQQHRPVYLACISETRLVLHLDPHLYLSCRLPLNNRSSMSGPSRGDQHHQPAYTSWNTTQHGRARVVDVRPGLVIAVGTDKGAVLVFGLKANNRLQLVMSISPPPSQGSGVSVTSLKLVLNKSNNHVVLFVSYHRGGGVASSPRSSGGGICCFDLGSKPSTSSSSTASPLARYDLDGRSVISSCLCDVVPSKEGNHYMVAQTDGLYTYSATQKVGVSPVDGTKIAMCVLPPSTHQSLLHKRTRVPSGSGDVGSLYALVASKDFKSGRDAIDIYDATNKLVAFHVLLSPGHRALRAVGIATLPTSLADNGSRGGRSSGVVLTSGGSIVTLTEKVTSEKVSLLVQKNLYAAAIDIAYCDPSYQPSDITALYRRHAEHLYRKGDYNAAMEQYIYTIGALESSHVIFRYLDAPKIPLLAKYLEELRVRNLATPVHNELLRACYLKLNDTAASEKIAAESSGTTDASLLSSTVSDLAARNPKDALATICSLPAPQAAEALVVHGASLARTLPHETAGVVVSLCVGTYSPSDLASVAPGSDKAPSNGRDATRLLEYNPLVEDDHARVSEPYPVHLFAPAFLENPKLLRLILAQCSRSKCPLTPSLRRTLLELTLSEWNHAKRTGDTEAERSRRKEAITALTDAHSSEIGDYEALVLVQQADFAEGELLLYERLQLAPMLLARYAEDGGERARRQMLAMCQSDPEILADVLGYFVNMASEKINQDGAEDDASDNTEGEASEILEDIREALSLARAQGVLPPVRIARILAGEGAGQFSSEVRKVYSQNHRTVPLSVALDYVGVILDESSKEISRLRSEVEEYNQLCTQMEAEIEKYSGTTQSESSHRINIDDIYARLRASVEEGTSNTDGNRNSENSSEGFWREMDHSEDRFDTIARFFAKGVVQ